MQCSTYIFVLRHVYVHAFTVMQTVVVPSVIRFRIEKDGTLTKTEVKTVEISAERLAREVKAVIDKKG